MKKIDCLDHGFVRLVSYMQPVEKIENWDGDFEIVRNARVSYDADRKAGKDKEGDEKLINYLTKNHHTTPFEAMTFTFEVKAPIFVFRQWHRHRTWSFNELSARYKELPEEFYVPNALDVGVQSKSSKQARNIDEEMTGDEIMQRKDECWALRKHKLLSTSLNEFFKRWVVANRLAGNIVYTKFLLLKPYVFQPLGKFVIHIIYLAV